MVQLSGDGAADTDAGRVRSAYPQMEDWLNDPGTVLHWYDFLCPFCYVAQSRNEMLRRRGFVVVELPFEVHPEIPRVGSEAGPRRGVMYTNLEREARNAGLILHWPTRLPNTRLALAAAEWVRQKHPDAFSNVHKRLFEAHFVHGEDLGDLGVISRCVSDLNIDPEPLHGALEDGSAVRAVSESESAAYQFGINGTPAWLAFGRLLSGLVPPAEFDSLTPQTP
jgi:predicted DsbA family dithiol-disulfide isomerase